MVYAKSLHQPEYRIMELSFKKNLSKEQIKVLFNHQEEIMNEEGIEKVLDDYNG